MIKDTKEKKVEKELQKKLLNDDTVKTRDGIEQQRKILEEKQELLNKIVTENKQTKFEVEQKENEI